MGPPPPSVPSKGRGRWCRAPAPREELMERQQEQGPPLPEPRSGVSAPQRAGGGVLPYIQEGQALPVRGREQEAKSLQKPKALGGGPALAPGRRGGGPALALRHRRQKAQPQGGGSKAALLRPPPAPQHSPRSRGAARTGINPGPPQGEHPEPPQAVQQQQTLLRGLRGGGSLSPLLGERAPLPLPSCRQGPGGEIWRPQESRPTPPTCR